MLDYFSHVSSLNVCLNALTAAPPTDPAHPQAVNDATSDAASEPGAAILGALMDHLLQYAQTSNTAEIKILKDAAELWQNGQNIYDQLTTVRTSMEAGMTTPSAPGVLDAYNAALAELPNIATEFESLQAQLETFQADFSGTWLTPVGRQQDKPVDQWAWRDIFLGRRSTAFVANAQSGAATVKRRAFAVGTLAGASGNFLGSGFLNAVVGGPRRSHQLRHRLASYSVGAWLRDNEPHFASDLGTIRTAISFGQTGPYNLPSEVRSLAIEALKETYPSGVPVLPDLEAGYRIMIEHLQLLQDFTLPPVPPPLNNTVTQQIIGLSLTPGNIQILGNPPASGSGSGSGSGGTGGGGGGTSFGDNFPGIGSHEDAGGVCATILLWIVGVGLIIALGISGGSDYPGKPGTGGSSPGHGPDPTVGEALTLPQLVSLSTSPAGLSTINSIYGLQLSTWQALSASRLALVLRGLLYPNPSDLSSPTFAQFVTIPEHIEVARATGYPHLPMPSSDDGTSYPTSGIETLATSPSPYAPLASPRSFLFDNPVYSIAKLSPTVWVDMIEKANNKSENLDLDSDRRFWAPCWTLPEGVSITDLPVEVVVLPYTGI